MSSETLWAPMGGCNREVKFALLRELDAEQRREFAGRFVERLVNDFVVSSSSSSAPLILTGM